MKYAIIIPDGCADWPIESFGNRTPLQAARTPHLDMLAEAGVVGRSLNVPESLTPGSDVATLSLLGYDPRECYTGRAPFEAAAMGIGMEPTDWAFRCNTVTIEDEIMVSFTADHLSSEESAELIEYIQAELPGALGIPVHFYPGVGYRNLMIWNGKQSPFSESTRTYPPHDYTGQSVSGKFPVGAGGEMLCRISSLTRTLLQDHPVNKKRVAAGKLPCTHFWFWGQGRRPNIASFARRYGTRAGNPAFRGAMITAVDLLRGIATYLEWDVINVPGATGYTDTDYAAKGRYAAEALRTHDLVCVHIESPDESGHEGDSGKKVRALEEIDAHIVPQVLDALKTEGKNDGWRLLVSPDHPTPCALKTHTHGEVPWLWVGSDIESNGAGRYDEQTAALSDRFYANGFRMMGDFIL